MSAEQSIETTADSVEEAIEIGLAELGVSPSDVIVEVLEEPVQGVFGMAGRPARVRLQILVRGQSSAPAEPATPISRPYIESTPIVLPTAAAVPAALPSYLEYDVEEGEDAAVPLLSETDDVPETEYDEEVAIGKVVLSELLERLGVRARIHIKRARPTDQSDTSPWILDVNGSASSRLIGKRGDTLAALQYVTRLITSRELQRRSEVIVDVDGYKARRARQLHALALRMAEDAMASGRVVALEPMPPHERRIIHLALRGREDVTTRSIGEGQGRKVTIVPRTQAP
jgi:spoIIIJ-associated protein